jgi:hypothetical protein
VTSGTDTGGSTGTDPGTLTGASSTGGSGILSAGSGGIPISAVAHISSGLSRNDGNPPS